MQLVVITNPAAGSAWMPERLAALSSRLDADGHRVAIVTTVAAGDGERLAAQAARDGADVVVAAGGDGTLNEVVNGLATVHGALERCALGILPAGTGNDFARGVGLHDPDVAIDALARLETRPIDLVSLGARVFLNASAGGFTAETSAQVTPDLKQAVGRLAYLIGGARALLEYEPVRVRVEGAGHRVETHLQLFAVCNGPYIGGGHQVAPTARPDDGAVEVCVVRASSTLEFLALLPRLSDGEHLEDDDVVYFRARDVTLTFERPIKVNTDGEVLELARCHYVVHPAAVRLVAPSPAGRPAA